MCTFSQNAVQRYNFLPVRANFTDIFCNFAAKFKLGFAYIPTLFII